MISIIQVMKMLQHVIKSEDRISKQLTALKNAKFCEVGGTRKAAVT